MGDGDIEKHDMIEVQTLPDYILSCQGEFGDQITTASGSFAGMAIAEAVGEVEKETLNVTGMIVNPRALANMRRHLDDFDVIRTSHPSDHIDFQAGHVWGIPIYVSQDVKWASVVYGLDNDGDDTKIVAQEVVVVDW